MVEALSVLITERRPAVRLGTWHKMDETRHYDANAEQYGHQSHGGAC